jgi:hypothetical protein
VSKGDVKLHGQNNLAHKVSETTQLLVFVNAVADSNNTSGFDGQTIATCAKGIPKLIRSLARS